MGEEERVDELLFFIFNGQIDRQSNRRRGRKTKNHTIRKTNRYKYKEKQAYMKIDRKTNTWTCKQPVNHYLSAI